MIWLLISFASITSNMLAAQTATIFYLRIVQDIRKILPALGAGTEAMYKVYLLKYHSVCCSANSYISAKQ